jgi:ABC-type amino acid transport substrate-binding protein
MLPKPLRESIEHLIIPRAKSDGEALITAFNLALKQLRDDGVIDVAIAEHLQ